LELLGFITVLGRKAAEIFLGLLKNFERSSDPACCLYWI